MRTASHSLPSRFAPLALLASLTGRLRSPFASEALTSFAPRFAHPSRESCVFDALPRATATKIEEENDVPIDGVAVRIDRR